MPLITCKLTGDVGPGIEAHIIPRSFYDFEENLHEAVKIVRLGPNAKATNYPIGEYDNTIVTKKGEAHFSEFDAYAHWALIKKDLPMTGFHRDETGNVAVIEAQHYDYRKLKLFFLSLLWRAGVSTRPFFSKVDLGFHEERLRRHILSGDPGEIGDFSVVISIYEDTPSHGFPIIEPHLVVDDETGDQHYKFDLGKLVASISFPGTRCPYAWNEIALSPATPLRILNLGEHRTTDFYQQMSIGVRELHKSINEKRQARK